MNVCRRQNVVPLLLKISSLHSSNKACSSFSVTGETDDYETNIRYVKDMKNDLLKEEYSSINSFTDMLVQERICKTDSISVKLWTENWLLSQKFKKQCNRYASCINADVNTPKLDKIDEMKKYVQDCLEKNIAPDQRICFALLHFFAQNGNKEFIQIIKDLSRSKYPEEYYKAGCYNHFLGEAFWRTGNIEIAVNLFWEVYEKHTNLRSKIKNMLRVLMAESIHGKGEAILVLLIKFSEKFVDSYSDYTLLSYTWEFCFLSDWHSDNEIASCLLEKFPKLKNYLSLKVIYLSSISLTSHKLEVVHRLFEVLLKYDMKKEYEIVLRSLFDYACSRRDVTACSAIIESSQPLGVSLTEAQLTKFLVLFSENISLSTKQICTPEFQFKF